MTETQHYHLKKPDPTDFYNIADFNNNADAIDAVLAKKPDMPQAAVTGNLVSFSSDGIEDSGKSIDDFLTTKTVPADIGAASESDVSALTARYNAHANNTAKHLTADEKEKLGKVFTTDDIVVSSTQPEPKEGRIWIKI